MKEKMDWQEWPLEHYQISLLIVGLLFVMGIYGMYVMPKDEFPAFTIRQGVVVAVYPGATTEEIKHGLSLFKQSLPNGVYAAPVESRIADIMENEIKIPVGVRSEVGGEIEYDAEALMQIFGGVAIAMVIIFFFLLFNFKKYGITTVCIVALGLMVPGSLIMVVTMLPVVYWKVSTKKVKKQNG